MPYHVGTSGSCPKSKPHAVIKDSDGEVMGCHSSKESAQQQIAAIHANEGDAMTQVVDFAASPAITGDGYVAQMSGGTAWDGVLAVEGTPTGDGRMFSENAITWAELPLPLRRNIEDSHGGAPTTKTVLVGRIDAVYRDPTNPLVIRGRGVFDDQGEHGIEAARLVRDGFLSGVSIDPDDIGDADVELVFPENDKQDDEDEMLMMMFAAPEMTIFHAGRIRAATLVDIPAFVEAKIRITDESVAPVVAASGHFAEISDNAWHGAAQERRLPSRMSARQARTAFAHVDAGDGGATKIGARFLHHEIDDAGDVGIANLTACASGIRAINAGRAEAMTTTDRRAAYEHMAQHLRAAGLTPPPYEGDELVASSFLERPPREWFDDPRLTGVTPLTITEDGRVFGHGAVWGTCHTGFADACVTPPAEPNGEHAYYRLGEVVCADGSRVAVGSITLGTGHAPVRNITSSQAAEHYDNTGTAIALVASGEDEYGIWVAGAIRPGTPESRVVELRAASLSGDWRRIGGALRLVAFLAVNRPGFPVPRTATFVSQTKQLSLVAAGVVSQDMRSITRSHGTDAALQRIAKSIGRDRESRMAALKLRVKGE